MSTPYIFDEFFASGRDETLSPFLQKKSRPWGKHLPLISSLTSALFLALAFAFSFTHSAISNFFLIWVYFLSGTPAFIHSLRDLRKLDINIDVLMTLAALLSVIIGSGMEGGLLLVLFELSGAMEEAVTAKTKGALLKLHELSPRTGYVIESDGTLFERSVKEIPIGTKLLVRAGELVPLDGKVIEGNSSVNLVHLTGESLPIPKKKGDEVPAGARNLEGTLTIEVTRSNADSTLTKIIDLITYAQDAKPKVARFLDKFSRGYAITIISLSTLFAITLPWIFHIPYLGLEGGIYRALAFLIAASPCALIIATPTAYLSAISSCAKRGILLKGGVALDALHACKTVAFDKTGTLTTGKLTLSSLEAMTPATLSEKEVLAIAYTLERNAVHPIAQAIVTRGEEEKLTPLSLEDFQSIPGSGLMGKVGGHSAYIGNKEFIEEKSGATNLSAKEGGVATFILIDKAIYHLHFTDTLRKEALEALPALKKRKMHLVMLSGDREETVQEVGGKLGFDQIFGNLRPDEKLAKVEELSKTSGLAMIGDGVNDAPALARSTVGISMGKIGSRTAVDASDVVFLSDDLSPLAWLFGKSKQTLSIVRQNLTLALSVIVCVTTPALFGFIPLWLAVILHEGGTVIVGLNSLRLLRK